MKFVEKNEKIKNKKKRYSWQYYQLQISFLPTQYIVTFVILPKGVIDVLSRYYFFLLLLFFVLFYFFSFSSLFFFFFLNYILQKKSCVLLYRRRRRIDETIHEARRRQRYWRALYQTLPCRYFRNRFDRTEVSLNITYVCIMYVRMYVCLRKSIC